MGALSKLDWKWTNWDLDGIEAGKAFVSEQKGETCVRHALGKGIFEYLQKEEGGSFYKGCTDEELEAKQETVIEKVLAIYPDQNAISPLRFNGESINLDVEKKSLRMEIRHARRNDKAFADAAQWASFKRDGSNFLIIGYDSHAVYVEDYDVASRFFNCINSWGPGQNDKPKIRDADQSITSFYAFAVHLVDDKDKSIASSQPSEPVAQSPLKGPSKTLDELLKKEVNRPHRGEFLLNLAYECTPDFGEAYAQYLEQPLVMLKPDPHERFRKFMRMWRGAIGKVEPREEARLMIVAVKKKKGAQDIIDTIRNYFSLSDI